MRSVVNTLVIACISALFNMPHMARGGKEAPETITLDLLQELYQPVIFNHQSHGEMYNCTACHHHTTGGRPEDEKCVKCHADSLPRPEVSCSGCHKPQNQPFALPADGEIGAYHIDKPALKGALHLQCLGCHHMEGGPTGCTDCHDFTPAGKKRFAVND